RVIVGVSYGGLSASFIGASRSDVFHDIAAFSPSLWVVANPQYLTNQKQMDGSKLMRPAMDAISQCGGETGFTCPRLPLKIFMSTGFADWDVGDFAPTAQALQQQGYPIEFHRVNEGHSWDNWRGLTDEMLIDFFGNEPTAPQPVMPALNDTLPDACRVTGLELYVNPYDGYCFAYPSNFELKMSPIGQPELYGPALDQNLDPLRAVLNLEVEVAVQNADLTLAVDTYLKQFADLNVPPITRTSITFGGEPAVQLEVVPGLAGSRDIFMLHNGTLYHLLFMPSLRDYPQAKVDVEELYNAVTHSFSFTSKKPRPLPTP
ncbi:MAG TPA: hypothetical protein VFK30_08125, partial [Anaerolineae bacterium]|nr:hypothetical protein [Anaerolineae bacterium]